MDGKLNAPETVLEGALHSCNTLNQQLTAVLDVQGAHVHSMRVLAPERSSHKVAAHGRQGLCAAHCIICSPVFLKMATLAALSAGRSVSSSSQPSCASIARMALRALGRMPWL